MNVSVTKVTATVGGSLVGKTIKEDIKKTIIYGSYKRFTSANHTPIRSTYMAKRLALVYEKYESQKILD